MQEYNSGNLEKYHTKNPLKKALVDRLNRRVVSMVREMMDRDDMRLLDAGCGEGVVSRLLADSFPSVNISGLECSDVALDIAQKSIVKNVKYGNLYQCDFVDFLGLRMLPVKSMRSLNVTI